MQINVIFGLQDQHSKYEIRTPYGLRSMCGNMCYLYASICVLFQLVCCFLACITPGLCMLECGMSIAVTNKGTCTLFAVTDVTTMSHRMFHESLHGERMHSF